MKLDYCHTKDTDITYSKIINDCVENPADKPANKEILIPLDYLELEKLD